MIWAMMCLYEHPRNKLSYPDQIAGTMLKTPLTGVDASTSWSLTFSKLHAQASLTTSITAPGMDPAVQIRFRKGNILVAHPPFCPKEYTVQWFDEKGSKIVKQDTRKVDWEGVGWHFQADEVARCIRDGKIESEIWTLEKSTTIMKIFDEVSEHPLQALTTFPEQSAGPKTRRLQIPSRNRAGCLSCS
jgi:predicted dehydrogenase